MSERAPSSAENAIAEVGGPEIVERLREVVLDLEHAKEAEKALREEATAVLDGLRAIAETRSAEELFSRLLGVMRAPLESDVALVLSDLEGQNRALSVIASTEPALLGRELVLGKTFARALGGRVTTLLDTSAIAELRAPPFDAIASAVLLPLAGDSSRALILFGSRAKQAFQSRHEQLVKRLVPLANQALREVERNAVISRQHHEMQLVLDHIDQGLLMIDLDGRIVGERSRQLDRWFGASNAATLTSFIELHAAELAVWFELALSNLRAGFMPAEVCIEQMPKRLEVSGRSFDVAYRMVMEGERLHRLLVIISDVTLQLARQRKQREQRELMGIFQRLVDDRAEVVELMAESSELVASLTATSDPVAELRILHTLKGNCAMFGLELFSEHCHALESALTDSLLPISDEQRRTLVEEWQLAAGRVGELLGSARGDVVEIPLSELAALLERSWQSGEPSELASALWRWTLEPVERRFRRLAEYARRLSRQLCKGEIDVAPIDGGVRIDGATWAPFWAVATHAVRNAIDHGIEPPDERLRRGKPPAGCLTFTAEQEAGWISITIADDGRGIDWEALRARARQGGLPHTSRQDLINAMFTDGVTTAAEVSATSGRGIGMAALRKVVNDLGGTIEVHSMPGAGTRISCHLPDPGVAGGPMKIAGRGSPTKQRLASYTEPPRAAADAEPPANAHPD